MGSLYLEAQGCVPLLLENLLGAAARRGRGESARYAGSRPGGRAWERGESPGRDPGAGTRSLEAGQNWGTRRTRGSGIRQSSDTASPDQERSHPSPSFFRSPGLSFPPVRRGGRVGGMLQANNTGVRSQCLSHTGSAPAHCACSLPAHTARALGCSAGNNPRLALGCMYLPGPSRSGSGTRIVLRGADSVGPEYCALPRSEQLK